MKLFDSTRIPILNKALDAYSARHKVIASNIANHVQVVDAASAGLSPIDPNDGVPNNVNIDNEMAELAKNQIRFKFSSKLLGETFRGLQKSIRGMA